MHIPKMTMGNKDFGAWDILTDSSSLGSPHTRMNTHLAQSGQIFLQIRFFKAILEVQGQILYNEFQSVCGFYDTQNDCLNLTVSTQKSV